MLRDEVAIYYIRVANPTACRFSSSYAINIVRVTLPEAVAAGRENIARKGS